MKSYRILVCTPDGMTQKLPLGRLFETRESAEEYGKDRFQCEPSFNTWFVESNE